MNTRNSAVPHSSKNNTVAVPPPKGRRKGRYGKVQKPSNRSTGSSVGNTVEDADETSISSSDKEDAFGEDFVSPERAADKSSNSSGQHNNFKICLETLVQERTYLVVRFVGDLVGQICSPEDVDTPFFIMAASSGLPRYRQRFRVHDLVRVKLHADNRHYNAEIYAICEDQSEALEEFGRIGAFGKETAANSRLKPAQKDKAEHQNQIRMKAATVNSLRAPAEPQSKLIRGIRHSPSQLGNTGTSFDREGSPADIEPDNPTETESTPDIRTTPKSTPPASALGSGKNKASFVYPYTIQDGKKVALASGIPVFIFQDHLDRITNTTATRANLASILCKHLLGGHLGIRHYFATKAPGDGIVSVHPQLCDAIKTYVHKSSLMTKVHGPAITNLGQVLCGALAKAIKSATTSEFNIIEE